MSVVHRLLRLTLVHVKLSMVSRLDAAKALECSRGFNIGFDIARIGYAYYFKKWS